MTHYNRHLSAGLFILAIVGIVMLIKKLITFLFP